MSLRQLLARAALLAGLLLAAGCGPFPFDDSCGPAYRETAIRGDIRGATGTLLGIAEFRLSEVRREVQPRVLHPIVMGPGYGSAGAPLKGHVTGARLLGPAGETLFVLPVAPGAGDEVLRSLPEPIADAASFSALKRSFRSGKVVLVLQTDLAGTPELRVPLPVYYDLDWSRASCS